MVSGELAGLNGNIRRILGIDHPVLSKVATYFFDSSAEHGKKMRPAMVVLMSQAVNAHMTSLSESGELASAPRSTYTTDGLPLHLSRTQPVAPGDVTFLPPHAIWPLQHRLAEITEMIHTASLLHDDVIDMSDTRRGMKSVNSVFGNKLAVLAGDFMLARASVCLARLRNIPVVELLSTVIEHLVKGEVMQMKSVLGSEGASLAAINMYLRKTYVRTHLHTRVHAQTLATAADTPWACEKYLCGCRKIPRTS